MHVEAPLSLVLKGCKGKLGFCRSSEEKIKIDNLAHGNFPSGFT